jgi:hypothetical protein
MKIEVDVAVNTLAVFLHTLGEVGVTDFSTKGKTKTFTSGFWIRTYSIMLADPDS